MKTLKDRKHLSKFNPLRHFVFVVSNEDFGELRTCQGCDAEAPLAIYRTGPPFADEFSELCPFCANLGEGTRRADYEQTRLVNVAANQLAWMMGAYDDVPFADSVPR